MPAKYSHVKKRFASGLLKKSSSNHSAKESHHYLSPDPKIDKGITQAMTAVSQLERAIARILLIRYEYDLARLYSTRLYSIALVHLPTFMMRCVTVGGPGWVAHNSDCDEIKDFFRAAISMDMRQAGERVATKSVLWSYTALRHFAMSNNVPICEKRGLHSLRLLPYYPALKAHLEALESMPPPSFTKPPHLGTLTEGLEALEEACELKYGSRTNDRHDSTIPPEWGASRDWRPKVRSGYERLSQTLWRVAREFDVRGYGMVLREKLTTKWCDCGCSTDHLGEVCERTVREDEEDSGVRSGKQREWDGRGSGVFGWETQEEEDIWEVDLDFGGLDPGDCGDGQDSEMTIGELMEWRYLRAEREKEEGNVAYRDGKYDIAVKHYENAHSIEPELPHYQLNLAAAHLKLNNWMEAEKACTKALGQHRSGKGYYRRAKARKMLGRVEDAIKDLRAILKLQPANVEVISELLSLLPPQPAPPVFSSSPPLSSSASSSSYSRLHQHPQQQQYQESSLNSPTSPTHPSILNRLHLPQPKQPKPPLFERTNADDRKLKIVLVPTTIDMPVPGSKDKRTDGAGKGKGKGKMGVKVKVKSETFAYPGWERYMVRRVD